MLPENSELLKPDNLLWIGGDELGVIETIKKSTDEQGGTILQVSGRFIESWLERRIIWGQYSGTEVVSNHLRNMVNLNAISPSDPKRVIPNLRLSTTQEALGPSISFSDSYSNLWNTVVELANSHSLFIRIKANVPGGELLFTILKGTNRSVEQSILPAVVLSTDLSDILTDSYTLDATSWCNMSLVAGAGEGIQRKTSEVNGSLSGLSRRELFVDARDLQDYEEVITSEGTTRVPIATSVYDGMLQERGKSKLGEVPLVESFDANIRMYGPRAYEYGVDYFLGDRITMQDPNLGIQVSTEISEVQQSWDENGYSLSLVLGTSAPTITQLLKRKE
jgi:hypothetical protein